jgi:hypothetical protein
MKKTLGLAGILFPTALFAAAFSKRTNASSPPPWTPPAPSNLPPPSVPSVPTEPPKPRAVPKTVKMLALHRYEIVADVLPVHGVSLITAARKILDSMRMDKPDLEGRDTVTREGVGEVTRVRFTANTLINNEIELDRQRSFAGVGSVWVVSCKEVAQ